MSSRWPKVIRDPVHGIIPFDDTPCDRLLLDLINTREFQRLRRIKQLGMTPLVFPGADHSRFAHSVGVMHTARLMLSQLESHAVQIADEHRIAVLAASLLHDVGHGPFSHAFETVTGESHERRTLEVISDDSTEVNAVLRALDPGLPELLRVFFTEGDDDPAQANGLPPFLTHIVSSQLDADRFDYLIRDSYATGTEYGRFDPRWLIHNLFADRERRRLYLGHKALNEAEQYVFARNHMYKTVYFHKTTRAAEVMLRLLFRRCRSVLDGGDAVERICLLRDLPPAFARAFQARLSLAEYLDLDDHSATEFFKACSRSGDPVIAMLSSGVLHRRLFKATDVTGVPANRVVAFTTEARRIIESHGYEPEFSLADDTPSDTAYKRYDPDADKPATQIYIDTRTEGHQELSEQSPTVKELTSRYMLIRYYYPDNVRDEIRASAEPRLQGARP